MKLEIRERDRRSLLLLVGAALVYAVFSFGILPAYDALKDASSDVGVKEEQLSRYRRALVRKGHYAKLLEKARKSQFLEEIRNAPKFITVRDAQIAPAQVIHEAPKKGDFKKVLRANLTVSAVLPMPPRKSG